MVCPLCGIKLEIRQINLDTAILTCPNLKCPYPVNSECLIIHRKLKNMSEERDIMILPDIKNESNVYSTPGGSKIGNDENEVLAAVIDAEIQKQSENILNSVNNDNNLIDFLGDDKLLENEINKLSQISKVDHNSDFNVLDFITDGTNISEYSNLGNDSKSDNLNFDVEDILNYL